MPNYDILSTKRRIHSMSKYYYLKYYDKTVAEIKTGEEIRTTKEN